MSDYKEPIDNHYLPDEKTKEKVAKGLVIEIKKITIIFQAMQKKREKQ